MREIEHQYDFVVAGGGLSGIAAALTAAREGLKTALVQDRPVLGGNSSKEIRVPPMGAYLCSFAYSRETGIIEEILLENLYKNPSRSYEGWDLVLNSFVKEQEGLDCFLSTHVDRVQMDKSGTDIEAVSGFTVGSELRHLFRASLFADCTGDATVGALAGAPFRTGIEARAEFGESMGGEEPAPHVMGSSIQMQAKDTGKPSAFYKPAWVDLELSDEDFGPYRNINKLFFNEHGGFWWLEWIGDLDPVNDTEKIKEQVLKIVYAAWDYLKNRSPIREKIANFELDWVGSIPGKRESRRLMGDHILSQVDIESLRSFEDAVAYGGWGFDDHPKEGFFSKMPNYHEYHAAPYNIPLRSLYSSKIRNLFMAGRNISVTHVGLSSTRVMLTCSQLGEAVGAAAAECSRRSLLPREAVRGDAIRAIQRNLQKRDHYIHNLLYEDDENIAPSAMVTASSTVPASVFEVSVGTLPLDQDRLWQFPISGDRLDAVSILVDATAPETLKATLYRGPGNGSTYPEKVLQSSQADVPRSERKWVTFRFNRPVESPGWYFLEVKANEKVKIHYGEHPPVGFAGYVTEPNSPRLANPFTEWKQVGRNEQVRTAYCIRVTPDQDLYGPGNAVEGWSRPTNQPNLWISQFTDFRQAEWIECAWDQPRTVRSIHLFFDSSLDFNFGQNWKGYNLNAMPTLIRDYRLLARSEAGDWRELVSVTGNYQRRLVHDLEPLTTMAVRLEVSGTNGIQRAQLYEIRIY
jgi:hypothetical protein